MDITIPRIRVIRPQHATLVVEQIVCQVMKVNFWVGFIGWWQLFKWIRPFLGQM